MRLRHKIVLSCAALLMGLAVIGETPPAQDVLRGRAKPNETPFQADDRYMGAGLAPIVYCFFPGVVLLVYGVGDLAVTHLFGRYSRKVDARRMKSAHLR